MMNRIRTAIERKRTVNQPGRLRVASGPAAPLTPAALTSDHSTVSHMDSVESAGGQLGAVLSAPRAGVVRARPAADRGSPPRLDQARQVLTDPTSFDFPGDVSRTGDLSGSRGETRSGPRALHPVDS